MVVVGGTVVVLFVVVVGFRVDLLDKKKVRRIKRMSPYH